MSDDQTLEHTESQATKKRSSLKSVIGFAVLLALMYFINVEVQSYLGRKAFADTGLPSYSLSEALNKAKAENKLVLADMSAIWCAACRKLDRQVLAKEEVQQAINKRYIFTRIEYESEEGKAFQKKYKVRGFPTLLILNPDGTTVRQLQLKFEPNQFIAQI